MLRFILKAVLFIFPLLILFAVIDYKAKSIPSNFAYKRSRVEQNLDRAQIIITGSSHAYEGIKPLLLGAPAVSIAYPGQDLYYDTRILLKYLPQASRAKLVIITVSYLSFEYLMEDSNGAAQTNFYYKDWGIPRQTSVPKIADYSAIALFGIQRSRYFLLTGKMSGQDQIDESGGDANLLTTKEFDLRNGQIAVKRHEAAMKAKYIAQNIKYLDELLIALKQRDIRAAFITTPCFHTYYNNLNAERYERMQKEIQALSRKYGLEYANYLRDERFSPEDFFDSDHLSTQGAEKFSYILTNEIIEKYISLP
jgi:hypothetical protein